MGKKSLSLTLPFPDTVWGKGGSSEVGSTLCTVTVRYTRGGLEGGISNRDKQALLKENTMLLSLDPAKPTVPPRNPWDFP